MPIILGMEGQLESDGDKIAPIERYGIKAVSMGFLTDGQSPVIWRGPMLHGALQQFFREVAWTNLDYLVIDLPPGTGDAQLTLAQSLPLSGSVMVTMPQQVSLDDASRCLFMFKELNIPVLGVVENMSYLELPDGTRMELFGKGGGLKLAEMGDVPLIASIPMEMSVREGGDLGEPIVFAHPDSPAAQTLRAMAESVAAMLSIAAFQPKGD